MKGKLRELRRGLKLQLSYVKRRIAAPVPPKNPGGEVLIHIGCEKTNSPEFMNIDAWPESGSDQVILRA
jgi:hypothetical protein